MDYQKKYLKYKNKYLELKRQLGSGPQLDKISSDKQIGQMLDTLSTRADMKAVDAMIRQIINKKYSDELLIDELNQIDSIDVTSLEPTNNLVKIYKIFERANDLQYQFENAQPGMIKLAKKIGSNYIAKKSCSVDEFMTEDGVEKMCNNPTLIKGSCSHPSFMSQLYNVNSNNDQIIELLNLIESKLPKGQTIAIVVGAHPEEIRDVRDGNIKLFFDSVDSFTPIETIIEKIKSNPLDNIYLIKSYFPTNITGSNIDVLNKILELTKEYKINFVNKMCGTCFRSMYYLVQKATQNFNYEVSPKQGLNSNDTEEIKTCFKLTDEMIALRRLRRV